MEMEIEQSRLCAGECVRRASHTGRSRHRSRLPEARRRRPPAHVARTQEGTHAGQARARRLQAAQARAPSWRKRGHRSNRMTTAGKEREPRERGDATFRDAEFFWEAASPDLAASLGGGAGKGEGGEGVLWPRPAPARGAARRGGRGRLARGRGRREWRRGRRRRSAAWGMHTGLAEERGVPNAWGSRRQGERGRERERERGRERKEKVSSCATLGRPDGREPEDAPRRRLALHESGRRAMRVSRERRRPARQAGRWKRLVSPPHPAHAPRCLNHAPSACHRTQARSAGGARPPTPLTYCTRAERPTARARTARPARKPPPPVTELGIPTPVTPAIAAAARTESRAAHRPTGTCRAVFPHSLCASDNDAPLLSSPRANTRWLAWAEPQPRRAASAHAQSLGAERKTRES